MAFKKTPVSTLPAIIEPLTESAKFWKNNVHPATVYKELNSINSIDINCHNQIITASTSKVSLYEPANSEKIRTFMSQNHTSLYCAKFRVNDPKIFAAGSGDGIVRIWECKNAKPLRLLGFNDNDNSTKHKAEVRRINFNGLHQLYSCGDDKEVKLWDFTQNSIITKFGGENCAHDDYIRASCLVENFSSFVTGSYDHSVKVWDSRSPQTSCFNYDHKHPVESVTNRDLLIISASNTTIQVFDMVAGKKLRTLENVHHKTITCIHNLGSYLLTASIDGHLKIYDLNFNVVTSFSYTPSQLLSCTYNGSYLAVGTNDGILSINKVSKSKYSSYKSKTVRMDNEMSNEFLFTNIPNKQKPKLNLKDTFVVKNAVKKVRYDEKHEHYLKKFKYTSALNRILKVSRKNNPEKVVNLMQELIRRNGLRAALAGRNLNQLKNVVKFLIENFNDLRFTRILLDVSLALVEIYSQEIKTSPKLKGLFLEINECIKNEIDCLEKMSELLGQLQFLINSQIK